MKTIMINISSAHEKVLRKANKFLKWLNQGTNKIYMDGIDINSDMD